MILSLPDYPLRRGRRPRGFDEQSEDQVHEVESMIESVGERTEIPGGVLAELERVVRPRQGRLQVAHDGVDPLELRQVSGLELAHHEGRVDAARVSDTGKTCQTIRGDDGAGRQIRLGPLSDGLARERRHWAELEMDRVALLVDGDRRHEGDLVGRSAPSLGAIDFTAEIGVIDLDGTSEAFLIVAVGHRTHDFVMHQPCGRVAHAELAFKRERRQPGLGLADQVDGQKPGGQGQFRAGEQRAGGDRGLMTAGIALIQGLGAAIDDAVGRGSASRTGEPIGPARSRQRVCAVRLDAKVTNEVRQRHAGLKLNGVAGHDGQSSKRSDQRSQRRAHRLSLAEKRC